jgi:hypothetical protein
MSKFLYHEPCPYCGSKDNLAVYDDGHKFCFGCKYQEQGTISIRKVFEPLTSMPKNKDFPWDAQKDSFRIDAFKWLLSCQINSAQRTEHNIQWSTSRQMLCWKIKSIQGKELGWQGRCFASDAKTKYFISGEIHADICLLNPFNFNSSLSTKTVVLVEDYISAIRVSSHYPCMPLFGCTCTLNTLTELLKHFNKLIVWLDSDKLDNARKIAQNASMMGFDSRVCYTSLDPKAYSNEEIKNYLEVFKC